MSYKTIYTLADNAASANNQSIYLDDRANTTEPAVKRSKTVTVNQNAEAERSSLTAMLNLFKCRFRLGVAVNYSFIIISLRHRGSTHYTTNIQNKTQSKNTKH